MFNREHEVAKWTDTPQFKSLLGDAIKQKGLLNETNQHQPSSWHDERTRCGDALGASLDSLMLENLQTIYVSMALAVLLRKGVD